MATTRKAGAAPARAAAPERWDLLGFAGVLFVIGGVLALVGLASAQAPLAGGAGAWLAGVLGRAAPLAAAASLVIGGAAVVGGARRQPIIDLTHVAAAMLFVLALAGLTDLAAAPADQSAPPGGGSLGGLVGSAVRAGLGDALAYLVLGLAAVLLLAYGLAASPLGVAALTRPGRAVILAVGFAAAQAARVVSAANDRARPWFRPADPDAAPTQPAPTPDGADGDPDADLPADDPDADDWAQQPLIRTTERVIAAAAPPSQHGRWQLPSIDLLEPVDDPGEVSEEEIRNKAAAIEDTLASFKVQVRVAEAVPGPVVTQYLVQPGPGVKVARITALANDLALNLAARSVRIEAPVPGRPYVGLETPNDEPAKVTLRQVMESEEWVGSKDDIKIALGQDVAGVVRVVDLASMPHVLIAGATGAGKSVCLNSLITGLLFTLTPDELQFVLIDPKMVELVGFADIPHLRMPVVTDVNQVVDVLTWVSNEMARRYRVFSKAGVRNLASYNRNPPEDSDGPLPYLVVIIDELADLMMTAPGDVERFLARLAQMARATGIHLVISTQRPSVDVITGLIKANFPTRISFMVSTQADSRTVLDMAGAERLIGRGDMLYSPPEGGKPQRMQGAWVADDEIRAVVEHWRAQGQPAPGAPPPTAAAANGSSGTNGAADHAADADGPDPAVAAGGNGAAGQARTVSLGGPAGFGAASETDIDGGEDEIYVEATELVMRHDSITPNLLARELGVGRSLALKLAHRLENDGFVGEPAPQSLRRPVLHQDPAD